MQVYLRLPRISSFLQRTLWSHENLNLKNYDYQLLWEIIIKAFQNSSSEFDKIPSIDTSIFRESLTSQDLILLKQNESGDAYLFMKYFNDFIKWLDIAVNKTKVSKLCKTAFQITFSLKTNYPKDSMSWELFSKDYIVFPAHQISDLIERSKSKESNFSFHHLLILKAFYSNITFVDSSTLYLDLMQNEDSDEITEFKQKWKGKFPKFLKLTLRNAGKNMLKEVWKIIENEEFKYDTEVSLISSIPKILWIKFEYLNKGKFNNLLVIVDIYNYIKLS